MNLTIVGATGGTGQQLVRQGLAAGHRITAIARQPQAVTSDDRNLIVVPGDVLDPAWAGAGIGGADAVLSALGTRQRGPTTLYSRGTAAMAGVMEREGVRRFIGISAAPVAPDPGLSIVERRLVYPLLYRFFGDEYKDLRAMEVVLAGSQLDWTIFRPPRLTGRPGTGRYRTAPGGYLPRARTVSRGDLAAAMLAAITDAGIYRQAVAIAN
jgi:putative NADH-flavin reductase